MIIAALDPYTECGEAREANFNPLVYTFKNTSLMDDNYCPIQNKNYFTGDGESGGLTWGMVKSRSSAAVGLIFGGLVQHYQDPFVDKEGKCTQSLIVD